MDIVKEVFKKTKPNYKKLKSYGFVLENGKYIYTRNFMEDSFKAVIIVDDEVSGKIYDLDLNEEYTNIYSDDQYGAYVSMVRNAYMELLEDIKDRCFDKQLFSYKQSLEVSEYMAKQYGDKPEFLWKKYPGYAIYRNHNSNKWYGIIMNVDGSKIGLDKKEYEILDVKSDPHTIESLKKEKGFHEAYHMDKDKWITIVLDGSVDIEIIKSLIDYSYQMVDTADAWIVPANPKYYDVMHMFDKKGEGIWKQSSDVHVGDIVYLYVADPYSCVMFQCTATKIYIPYEYKDKNVSMNYVMSLKLLKRYKEGKINFKYLNSLGIKAIRGPRRLKKETAEILSSI